MLPLRLTLVAGFVAASLAPAVHAQCVVMDNGTGTIDLPPDGCGYVSPMQFHVILNGVPAGAMINIDPAHDRFFCLGGPGTCETPGGPLGGTIDAFDSTLTMHMQGTDVLSGFSRTIPMQLQCEVFTGPRNPGQPIQLFPTEFNRLQGALPPGDPDFLSLTIQGGSALVGPSPGQTTLTSIPGGDFVVDSFFDIAYRIDFVGAPGGALAGMAGSTTGTITMAAGAPPTPSFCDASDGALALCPCANPGNPLTGCDNPQATGGVGADVTALDTAGLTATITGTGYPPMGAPTAIVIRANNQEAVPQVFFDGLRCVGLQGFARLAATAAGGGTSNHSFGHGAGPGTYYYQIWYRSTPITFCDATAAANTSNGREIVW